MGFSSYAVCTGDNHPATIRHVCHICGRHANIEECRCTTIAFMPARGPRGASYTVVQGEPTRMSYTNEGNMKGDMVSTEAVRVDGPSTSTQGKLGKASIPLEEDMEDARGTEATYIRKGKSFTVAQGDIAMQLMVNK